MKFLSGIAIYAICLPLTILTVWIGLKISEWYKSYIDAQVRARIGWWSIGKSSDAFDYIQRICKDLNIEERYLIKTEDEKEIALDIVAKFQEYGKYLYSHSSDFASAKLARRKYSDFFMRYFEHYLDEHDSYYFKDNKMYIETSRKYYSENVTSYSSYESTCTMTQYGVVYNKLHYMAILFCEKSPVLSKGYYYYSDGKKTTLDQALESKEILFIHHGT